MFEKSPSFLTRMSPLGLLLSLSFARGGRPIHPPKKAEKIVPKTTLFAVLNSAELGGRETDRPTFFALRTRQSISRKGRRGEKREEELARRSKVPCQVGSSTRRHERRATRVSLQKKDCGGGGCTQSGPVPPSVRNVPQEFCCCVQGGLFFPLSPFFVAS